MSKAEGHVPEHPVVAKGLFELLTRIEAAIHETPVPTDAATALRSLDDDIFWTFPRSRIMIWTARRGLAGIQIEMPSSRGGWHGFCAWTPAQGLAFASSSLQDLINDAVRPLPKKRTGA